MNEKKNTRHRNIEVLDCTVRDGGHLNRWHFEKKLVREIYRVLSKTGVDYIELGCKGSEKYFDKTHYGLWRFCFENDLKAVTESISGAKVAVLADFGKIDLDDFTAARDSVISLVRLAVNKDQVREAIVLLEKIKEKGYTVSLNAMGYTNYTRADKKNLLDLLKRTNLDYIYIADSYGSLFPQQLRAIFKPLIELNTLKVGFHPHNNLQMAFANTIEAIKCGVHIVDSAIFGMGRAAGNLPTEILISYFENLMKGKYNSIPLLELIDREFTLLQKENKWGYQLSYMISGMFQCHPEYAKHLIDMKEFTIEDIWKAMEYIRNLNPVGYKKDVVDHLVHSGIIQSGSYDLAGPSAVGTAPAEKTGEPRVPVSYRDRYPGRDFLILANGPTLEQYQDKIQAFILKNHPVVLGGNFLSKIIKPHYHAFNNKRRFIQYIDTVDPESKLLLGQYLPDSMIKEFVDRSYDTIYYKDELASEFTIRDGVIQSNCRSIAGLLMATAIVMGAKRIFAVGIDGYLDTMKIHFYNEPSEKENRNALIEMHYSCQKVFDQIDSYLVSQGKEGINILTPTSYKRFYKGIDNYIR